MVWPTVRKHVLAAIKKMGRGRYSEETTLDDLLNKRSQLWVIVRDGIVGAVVTQIVEYPTGKRSLNVWALGGHDVDNWIHLWSDVEAWARENGCDMAEMHGRLGWQKKLGWFPVGIEMVKEL